MSAKYPGEWEIRRFWDSWPVRKEGGLTMASLVHWLKQVDPEHPLLGKMKTEFREKRKAEEEAEERAYKERRVIDEDDDHPRIA
jgi:hypothetical protein